MEQKEYYIKGDEIGRGAYKIVFKAIDRRKGIEVAWNELDLHNPSIDPQKLLQEIQILGTIDTPHIIRFYEYWNVDMKIIFITELMTSSLRSFVKTAGFVSIGALKKWCKQILAGLDYLHRHWNPPIIHRDIKLDNIFFNGATGQVKIGDLGLATILSQNSPMSIIGTPEFMAPEFYNETYDEKVDIWAFGLCVIEMATQEYPYQECSNVGSIYRTVSSGLKPQALAKIKNHKIIEFVCCCLEEDISKRLSSAELLNHPFLLDEPELDAQYTSLSNEEEFSKAFQIIGTPSPTKQGWEIWIANTVTPIRESRKKKLNSQSQPASPIPDDRFNVAGEDNNSQTPPFNSTDFKNLVPKNKIRSASQRNSGQVSIKKRAIPEEDDVILDDPPHITVSSVSKANSESNNRKTSLTSNSTPEASNRLENQITKNLKELSSSTPVTGGPIAGATGVNTSTSFTQNPNSSLTPL